MMAMLWAQQIMLGKKEYKDVPRLLKEKVKEILIDSGFEELVTDLVRKIKEKSYEKENDFMCNDDVLSVITTVYTSAFATVNYNRTENY